jgi:hypothetical protein
MFRIAQMLVFVGFAGLLNGQAKEIAFFPELTEAMRLVAMKDWQTDAAWLPDDPKAPRPARPSDEFVKRLAAKCRFESVDLNHDGINEVIVDVQFSPGVTGNATYHVLQKRGRAWTPIGYLQGKDLEIIPVANGADLLTTISKLNLASYTHTVYVWRQGQYQEGRSKEVHPEEIKLEPVTVSTNGRGITLTFGEAEGLEQFGFRHADEYLNQVYHRLLERLDAEGRQKLRAAQRKWLAFRDAEAESLANAHRNDGLGGAYKTASLAKTTWTRGSELDARLQELGVRKP